MSQVLVLRARLAGLTRHHHPPETLAAARRDLAVANAVALLRRLTAVGPPLTREQRAELEAVLRTGKTP